MFDDGEVHGCLAFADAGGVVAEGHIHHPMEGIFDRPMAADGMQQPLRVWRQRGDVIAGFGGGSVLDDTDGFDAQDRGKASPAVLPVSRPALLNMATPKEISSVPTRMASASSSQLWPSASSAAGGGKAEAVAVMSESLLRCNNFIILPILPTFTINKHQVVAYLQ